jgi:hypothetical protein
LIKFRSPAITAIASLVPIGEALGQLAINMAGNEVIDSRYFCVRVSKMGKLRCSFDSHACPHVFYPALPTFVFCNISFLRFCCSQISDHQRRRSHQHQQQPVAAVAVASTGPLSVQILNYEASLLQEQVC